MKKLICCILSASLFAAVVLTGCTARSASSEKPAPASAAESSASEPEPEASPSEAASSAPEKEETFPVPTLTPADEELLLKDVGFFLSYIGAAPIPSTKDLDADTVLFATLVNIYQQKDINAYTFEDDGNGWVTISADLVAEHAERLFGLEGFAAKEEERYNADKNAYRYNPGHDGNIHNTRISPLMGAPGGNVAYDISFFANEPDTVPADDDIPRETLRYTFKLLRLNGMPYLQLQSIADVTAK